MPGEITVNEALTAMLKLNECVKDALPESQNRFVPDLIGLILMGWRESLGDTGRARTCHLRPGDPIYDSCGS